MYFTVESNSADRLLGASTPVAASVQIHETVMDDHGAMGMHALESLEVPADTEVVLEPGGLHLMLIDVDRLEVGERAEVLLTWENAGEMRLDVEVVETVDTMGHEGHDG
jgi:copper(I)-binding protein